MSRRSWTTRAPGRRSSARPAVGGSGEEDWEAVTRLLEGGELATTINPAAAPSQPGDMPGESSCVYQPRFERVLFSSCYYL